MTQTAASPLHVAIDARCLASKSAGGVVAYLHGVLGGLSAIADESGLRVTLLVMAGYGATAAARYLSDNFTIVELSTANAVERNIRVQFPLTEPIRQAIGADTHTFESDASFIDISKLVEKERVDVLHCPFQFAITANDVPIIYQPHDLQHLHLPQNFSRDELINREKIYRFHCHTASTVAVTSHWVANDVCSNYGVSREKTSIIPAGPVHVATAPPSVQEIIATCSRYSLVPGDFILLPAQTWPHKNHQSVLRALAHLKQTTGFAPKLVITGFLNDYSPKLAQLASELGLVDQVHFLGLVDEQELMTLYALARCMVMPTLFESDSIPISEAFAAGCPVACANTTSLPSQVGDAALVFDPFNIPMIAGCIQRLWVDGELRQALAERGRERVRPYNWEMTSRAFSVLYKKLAKRPLTPADEAFFNNLPVY